MPVIENMAYGEYTRKAFRFHASEHFIVNNDENMTRETFSVEPFASRNLSEAVLGRTYAYAIKTEDGCQIGSGAPVFVVTEDGPEIIGLAYENVDVPMFSALLGVQPTAVISVITRANVYEDVIAPAYPEGLWDIAKPQLEKAGFKFCVSSHVERPY